MPIQLIDLNGKHHLINETAFSLYEALQIIKKYTNYANFILKVRDNTYVMVAKNKILTNFEYMDYMWWNIGKMAWHQLGYRAIYMRETPHYLFYVNFNNLHTVHPKDSNYTFIAPPSQLTMCHKCRLLYIDPELLFKLWGEASMAMEKLPLCECYTQ